jgi:protoheme IX farnesyltransferase
MKSIQTSARSINPNLRYLMIATSFLAFALILLGVMVRVSDSSSACPDWPTCSGSLVESVGTPAFLPYVHRVIAALTGIGLLALLGYAWLRYRRLTWLVRPLAAAVGLMAIQVLVGRLILVQDELTVLSALHFSLSLGILALTVFPLVISYHASIAIISRKGEQFFKKMRLTYTSPFSKFSLWTLIALLVLYISGSWVSASGAQAACQGWPLCGGLDFPVDNLTWIILIHRFLTLVTGLMMGVLFIKAWRTQRSQTAILVATTAAAVLFYSQSLLGAVEAAQAYPGYLVALHAATAVAVWVSMVTQVTLVGLADRTAAVEREEVQIWKNRNLRVLLKDYLILTKPIVVALLLVTTFAGMVVGAEAWPDFTLLFWTLVGGFLAAGGSGAINQYIDRLDDNKMQRTAKRPIPSGRLTPGEGLAFGVAATITSFYLMVAMVNFLAALLTLAGIIYYVLLYSVLLKKTTVQNIVIGGGAGAIPPLVGWAAATGSLNIPSLFLFAVVFMWTPPHFWALALVRRKDYARAGVPMLPVVRGERETRWQIFLYTIELVGLTLVLPVFGLGGGIYFVAALLLGGLLVYSAWKVWQGAGNKVAWKMYRHSSMYLAFLFLALMVDALL